MVEFLLGGVHWGLWFSGFIGTFIVVIAAIGLVVFLISETLETWQRRRRTARESEWREFIIWRHKHGA